MCDFDNQLRQEVWKKGQIIPGFDPDVWRKDVCGAWILRAKYGNRDSDYGWEIDHIIPKAQGGTDNIENLRPLHWFTNASRQDGPLVCKVTARGNRNVEI